VKRIDLHRTPVRFAVLAFGLVAVLLSGCTAVTTAVREGHESQQAYYSGVAHFTAKDYAAAVAPLERAVSLDPTLDSARAYLAWTYYELADYPRATRQFRLALARQPQWPGLHDGLGWTRYYAGRYHIAMDAFREAIALDPNYRDARVGLAYALFALGRYDEARPLLETLVREGEKTLFSSALPDVEDVRARYAWTLFYLDDFQGARTQFLQGLAAHPTWAGLHNGLGWSVLRLGDRAGAQRSFQQALALRSDFDDARQGLVLAQR
jgi:tetratricopeptide (TPR) repeat protein